MDNFTNDLTIISITSDFPIPDPKLTVLPNLTISEVVDMVDRVGRNGGTQHWCILVYRFPFLSKGC